MGFGAEEREGEMGLKREGRVALAGKGMASEGINLSASPKDARPCED